MHSRIRSFRALLTCPWLRPQIMVLPISDQIRDLIVPRESSVKLPLAAQSRSRRGRETTVQNLLLVVARVHLAPCMSACHRR